jgi:hypothetical protein
MANRTLDEWLDSIGETVAFELLSIALFTTTCILSLVFNLGSFYVFKDKFFAVQPYVYLRVYVLVGALMNVLELLSAFASCKRFFPVFSTIYSFTFYMAYVNTPIKNTLLYHIFLLDVAIVIDNIPNYHNRLRKLFRIPAKKINVVFLVITFIINVPFFLSTTVEVHTFYPSEKSEFSIHFVEAESLFANTELGIIILNVCFTSKHGLTLIVE